MDLTRRDFIIKSAATAVALSGIDFALAGNSVAYAQQSVSTDTYYKEATLELIKGAYDLHIHSHPSHTPRSVDDFEVARKWEEIGMAGGVIKCHWSPTAARAYLATKYAVTKVKVFGSLSLNYPCGALNPDAVEKEVRLGAKIVWMPTRDARNDMKYEEGYIQGHGITILNDKGKIVNEVYDIMDIIKSHDACLATGHLSPEESVLLANESTKRGVATIITHPDWKKTKFPLETLIQLANKGAFIERVFLNVTMAASIITMEEMAASIKKIGMGRCFITTDYGQKGNYPSEGMLKFIQSLLENGVTEKEITAAAKDVPKALLNIK